MVQLIENLFFIIKILVLYLEFIGESCFGINMCNLSIVVLDLGGIYQFRLF